MCHRLLALTILALVTTWSVAAEKKKKEDTAGGPKLLMTLPGKPLLDGKGEPPDPVKLARPIAGVRLEWWIYAGALIPLGVVWLLMQRFELVGYALLAGSIIVLLYLIYFMITHCTRAEGHSYSIRRSPPRRKAL